LSILRNFAIAPRRSSIVALISLSIFCGTAQKFQGYFFIRRRLPSMCTRRHALDLLFGGFLVACVGTTHPVQAQSPPFTDGSLHGTYAYINNSADVGSLGLIVFDGSGGVTAQIKVNQSDNSGGRKVTPTSGSGTYSVPPAGTGTLTIQFEGLSTPSVYDFVITDVNKRQGTLATEVFAVAETPGFAGQLVAPTWKRISD